MLSIWFVSSIVCVHPLGREGIEVTAVVAWGGGGRTSPGAWIAPGSWP